MRKKIKMNLGGVSPGGIPPNVSSLFNIANYLQGQQSLPGSGEGLDMLTGPDNAVFSQAPLGAPAGLNPLGPNTVTSSAYGMLDKSLQPTMDMQPFINANTPAGTGTIGGSGMGMMNLANMGLGMLEQDLAMPENEFDQAQDTLTKVKKGVNLFQRGRDAVQHAHNLKKARDIAKASTDTASLLTNLNAVPTSAAASAATEGAKTGVGQFIANAGASKMGTFLSSGAGAATTAGVGILGKYIQERDKRDGNYSKAGAKIGGAMQGAAMGSMLGPIGTVVGAGVGAAVGAAQRNKFIKQEKFDNLVERTNEKANDAEKDLAKRAVLQTYPTKGIRQQVYAKGGEQHPPGTDEILEFAQTGPDFETYGPGLRIDGETYQASRNTGATRIPTFTDGTQIPILLGAAEVYDEPISAVPDGYTPETQALADEGARGVADRRNQAAGIGLAAVGDFFSAAQRYGVSAPLALAMGKTPNLSPSPLLDRAVGAESPNAFPSEILDIQNPYGAIATDILTDPMAALSLAAAGRYGAKAGSQAVREGMTKRGMVDLSDWRNLTRNPYGFREVGAQPNIFGQYKMPTDPMKMDLTKGFDELGAAQTRFYDEGARRGLFSGTSGQRLEDAGITYTQSKSPLGKKLGQGSYGAVHEFAGNPNYTVKFGGGDLASRFSGLTDDFLQRASSFADQPNIAVPLRAGRTPGSPDFMPLVSPLEHGPKEILVMPNLGRQNVTGNFATPSRDSYALAKQQVRALRDQGIAIDMDNPANMQFNPNTGKFDIFDLENVPQLQAKNADELARLEQIHGPIDHSQTTKTYADPGGYTQQANFYIDRDIYVDKVRPKSEKGLPYIKERNALKSKINTSPWTASYRTGGYTSNPDYLAEGGEMIQHAPGDLPKTDNNGSVTPVTNTIARINGDKHTAPSGGVGMEGDKSARIYSDQLYVSEDLLAQLSKL